MKKAIHTQHAPNAIGPYSQAIDLGQLVFLSGQIGLDPLTMEMVSGGFAAEAAQVFKNMQAVIEAVGLTFAHVVKLTIFLTDFADFASLNEIMKQHFTQPYPARSTVQVAALPKGALVEVEAILAR